MLELETQALRNLKRMEVKLLMLDEVHNILAGSAKEHRVMLNTLRYISNELQISLVCLGIGDAREAIGGDVQLMRRFDELTLPRWQGDAELRNWSTSSCATFRSNWRASSRRGPCAKCCASD